MAASWQWLGRMRSVTSHATGGFSVHPQRQLVHDDRPPLLSMGQVWGLAGQTRLTPAEHVVGDRGQVHTVMERGTVRDALSSARWRPRRPGVWGGSAGWRQHSRHVTKQLWQRA